MSVATRVLKGSEVEVALDDVARLRIAVFRDWPYLYDGDLDYERRYLQVYRDSPGTVLVGAFDGPRLIGAATGTPMEDHAGDFAAAFAATGLPLEAIFYCAESVLLPEYRGRGIGHRFFDLREDHARTLGRSHIAFCSVLRPDDHPLKPPGARSNDDFWRKRGYRPMPGVVAEFSWKDIGDDAETRKPLAFWIKTV